MECGEITPHLATLVAKIVVTPWSRQRSKLKEEAMSTCASRRVGQSCWIRCENSFASAITTSAPSRRSCNWIRRFIEFHGKRHPTEMGARELAEFLSDLAIERNVSASTQNQALNAILSCIWTS